MAASTIGLGAQANGYNIRADVLKGIQQASANTGVDFAYLMAQAAKESGFDPDAKAKSSSAAGLYQFVEQTWLSVVRKHGAEHGLGNMASKIKISEDGKLRVADQALRKQILDLRRDPVIAAAMAAEHAADNEQRLEAKLGREVEPIDLYLAHFLGLNGATSFLRAMESNPNQGAASLFPKAAAANRSVFYRTDGSQRTLQEIYDRFESRMTTEMAAYDDLEGTSAGGATLFADVRSARSHGAGAVGDGAIYGQTNPGGVLSPFMLVTLASLPTGRDRDDDVSAQRNSLFNRATIGNPTA
ncbi:transglycosylase SLT domain-containing protein [Dongia deserti]|uniref:transglycosylase SLT domain-containing protein n=1 Tax=Dongia deserti TaxID=2268030 RepID=UPI000E65D003|nr:transglycosylase SLT domain-containing protein [Dongia deserti]